MNTPSAVPTTTTTSLPRKNKVKKASQEKRQVGQHVIKTKKKQI